jgi:hypothetical protein
MQEVALHREDTHQPIALEDTQDDDFAVKLTTATIPDTATCELPGALVCTINTMSHLQTRLEYLVRFA